MPSIRVLPPDLRNKIAAGEVIERPASVVKELLENSIDAGSTEIKVFVSYGGKRSMKVLDNGCGMDREDALLCFERHATSKLNREEDLFGIRTLGFRGEALPSIASVSRLRMITGLAGSSGGVSVEIEGEEIKEVRESAFSGTSVEVKELFFNVPARKKFLKTNNTELVHIVDTVTRQAMVHHEIGFSLWSEDRESMTLPRASGYRERLLQIYGEEYLKGLLEVEARGGEMGLHAFISADDFRTSRAHQFVFINGRPVREPTISHAVYKSFEGILPSDKHPAFFVFFEIDPALADFNVHPSKREVRFRDKEPVHRFVLGRLREKVKSARAEYVRQFTTGALPEMQADKNEPVYTPNFHSGPPVVSENIEFTYRPSLPFLYLGDTFIAVSAKGGLMIIDHHAAHERILYEKFLKGLSLDSCQLLFPERVRLSRREYTAIIEKKDLLSDFGIDAEDFGPDTLLVRSAPEALKGADLRGILSDIAEGLIEGTRLDEGLKEKIAAKIACHSSVRGREVLNQEESAKLLSDLEKTDSPDQCPHGRPTRILYSLDTLKKMFGRK